MREYVQVTRNYRTIDNKSGSYTESWPVPDDFNSDDVDFYAELCLSGNFTPSQAQETVRKLLKDSTNVQNATSPDGQYNISNNLNDNQNTTKEEQCQR